MRIGTTFADLVLYCVTSPFAPGVPYGSNDSLGTEVDTASLTIGETTPFVKHLLTAKGLVYLDATGAEPVLPLSSAAGAVKVANPVAATPIAAATKSASDSDALPVVLAIVALVLALGVGGLSLGPRVAKS